MMAESASYAKTDRCSPVAHSTMHHRKPGASGEQDANLMDLRGCGSVAGTSLTLSLHGGRQLRPEEQQEESGR